MLLNNNITKTSNMSGGEDHQGGQTGRGYSLQSKAHCEPTVILNVGGSKHETKVSTLQSIPGTKLSNLANVEEHHRPDRDEYYFDRNGAVFEYILNFYRTHEFHMPHGTCSVMLKRELEFWGIREDFITDCCWLKYNEHKHSHRVLLEFEKKRDKERQMWCPKPRQKGTQRISMWQRVQPKLWTFLDDPYTSTGAKVFAAMSLVFVMISIFTYCAETHPLFKSNMTLEHYAEYHNIHSSVLEKSWNLEPTTTSPDGDALDNPSTSSMTHPYTEQENEMVDAVLEYYQNDRLSVPHPALDLIDLICYIFFTSELFLRFLFCPRKKLFFTSFFNVVDLLTLLPFYLEIVIHSISSKEKYRSSVFDALFAMRILRIFRVFRLVRHNKGLQVLVYTLKASVKEMFLLMMFLAIGTLIFASLIYYTDHDNQNFKSIPHGFWWAMVTMTTVGYGDMVPRTHWGHFVGAFCAIGGVLMIAFTVPVIVNNFLLFYQQVQYGKDLEKSNQLFLCHKTNDSNGNKEPGTTDEVLKDAGPSVLNADDISVNMNDVKTRSAVNMKDALGTVTDSDATV